ncbi:MAG: hypothetical protein KH050_08530 [Clostridiaceae bacterium]|nr:hypothetical protein [Clostridiaceae bacterium]
MEKYTVNGKTFEYDTFDLENMERYDREARRIEEQANHINANGENYISVLREIANSVLDFFDVVVGDGMAREIFGERVNFRDIMSGYREFTEDVAKAMQDSMPAPNREQRRRSR